VPVTQGENGIALPLDAHDMTRVAHD
jgi:hypothetical protein